MVKDSEEGAGNIQQRRQSLKEERDHLLMDSGAERGIGVKYMKIVEKSKRQSRAGTCEDVIVSSL